MASSSIEVLPPKVEKRLMSTENGKRVLADLRAELQRNPEQKEGWTLSNTLGTLWSTAKWTLLLSGLLGGGLALGSHTGAFKRIPAIAKVGPYLDAAGKWVTDTAMPAIGTGAQWFWDFLKARWAGLAGVASPERVPEILKVAPERIEK